MAIPDIGLGEPVTDTCKHLKPGILFAFPKKSGGNLTTNKDNTAVDKRLAFANPTAINYTTEFTAGNLTQCKPEPKYEFTKGRLLRVAVKDLVSTIKPKCYSLALVNYEFYVPSDELKPPPPWRDYKLYYRGAYLYPIYYDPTDPDKGGSGHTGYTTWALKRGSGSMYGGCSSGQPSWLGTIAYRVSNSDEVMQTGTIVDGVIQGFPPTDTIEDTAIEIEGIITGSCINHISIDLSCDYYFCVYPPGVSPGPGPGPG